MELHAHTHTPRRKWTHYFWEFIMLFLAVFCGFLAEYQLEHTIEHQREKQFAKQLLADLRADSSFFAKRTRTMAEVLEKHKRFFQLMTGPVRPSNKDILMYSLPLVYTFDIQVTTATYDQMKTSGSLRYIRNNGLTGVLQHYYEVLLPRVIKASAFESDYYAEHIDPYYIKHFRRQDFDFINDTVKTNNPVILNRTEQSDQELLNILESYGDSHRALLERLALPAINKLHELIALLKKEYRLE